jgi:hypothetical protein
MTKKSIVNTNKQQNPDVCLNDCDVTELILKYLVPIFQYLSIEMEDYNMKLKTTKCLNTAVMLVYILGNEKNINNKIEYCDTEKINKRYNRIKDNKKKIEKKKDILDKLEKDIKTKNINSRYFYYILMTHTKMYKDKTNYGWFPGHVFIVEKSNDCQKNLRYKLFQSYINQYDLNGHFKNNNNTMDIKDNNITNIINGIKNILLKKTWNKKAVTFWNKLCYVKTDNLLNCSTQDINICYQKIKINNCYINLLNFTKKALKNIKTQIDNKNFNYYYVKNEKKDNNPIQSLKIEELYNRFQKLHDEIIN